MEHKNYKILLIVILILCIFSLFLTIKHCLTQAWFLSNSRGELRALVQYSKVMYPPTFKDQVKELAASNKLKESILNELELDGCWTAVVKNKGNVVCTRVSLRLPYSKIFIIKRDYLDPVVLLSKNVAPIGNLAPLEEVTVYGWTSEYKEPSFKEKDSINLIHDNGIGRVALKLPLKEHWYYFSRLWPLLLFIWTIIVSVIILLCILIIEEFNDPTIFRNRPHLKA